MAIITTRLARKNDSDTWDLIYIETGSDVVMRPSGISVESDLETYLPEIQSGDELPSPSLSKKLVIGDTKAFINGKEVQFVGASEILPIEQGGTGAGTVELARANLDINMTLYTEISQFVDPMMPVSGMHMMLTALPVKSILAISFAAITTAGISDLIAPTSAGDMVIYKISDSLVHLEWYSTDTLDTTRYYAFWSAMDMTPVTWNPYGSGGSGGGSVSLKGTIAAWSGGLDTIPTGWVVCDGTNDTPNLQDRFIVGANVTPAPIIGSLYPVGDVSSEMPITPTGYSLIYIMCTVDGAIGGGGATGDYIPISEKGIADGVATLGSDGKVPLEQLPDIGGDGTIMYKTIVAWSGTVDSIPVGWVICDGTNETPDLRNRFILGKDPADIDAVVTHPVGDIYPVTENYMEAYELFYIMCINQNPGTMGIAETPITGDYIPTAQMGVAGGVATLNEFGKIPAAQLDIEVTATKQIVSSSTEPTDQAVGDFWFADGTEVANIAPASMNMTGMDNIPVEEIPAYSYNNLRNITELSEIGANAQSTADDIINMMPPFSKLSLTIDETMSNIVTPNHAGGVKILNIIKYFNSDELSVVCDVVDVYSPGLKYYASIDINYTGTTTYLYSIKYWATAQELGI